MKKALTVAGFDPCSGAGVTADIKVFRSLGVFGIGVISSVTAQNTLTVKKVEPVSDTMFRGQLDAILNDISVNTAKTGMLYEKSMVRHLSREVDRGRIRRLVIDPVIVSTSGHLLIKRDALTAMIDELIPRCLCVTPNVIEAENITGKKVIDTDDMARAAEDIHKLGAKHVLIKGGHIKGDASDVFYDGRKFRTLVSKRVKGDHRGTGCVLSAAITAYLARGYVLRDAIVRAKQYINRAFKRGHRIGHGLKVLDI